MIVVMIMVMIVVMIVIVAVQEFRLDVEDAVEIEGVAAEHLGRARSCERCGAMQLGIGIDAADARLDLAQLRRRSRDRSC